jgi:hypothetical protein
MFEIFQVSETGNVEFLQHAMGASLDDVARRVARNLGGHYRTHRAAASVIVGETMTRLIRRKIAND